MCKSESLIIFFKSSFSVLISGLTIYQVSQDSHLGDMTPSILSCVQWATEYTEHSTLRMSPNLPFPAIPTTISLAQQLQQPLHWTLCL